MSDEREKCFVMMPISDQGDYSKGHFSKVYEQIIKPAVEAAGYEAYRVDDNKISDTIMSKIFDAIQNCPMAVCDMSNRNPNVLYELGLRQAYDKPVVLMQDDKTERIFDVSGISTVSYNNVRLYENVLEAKEELRKAIVATKEGKQASIAKIVKAKAADFSLIQVSSEDKTQLMFTEIINRLQILEQTNDASQMNFHVITKSDLAKSNVNSQRIKAQQVRSEEEKERLPWDFFSNN